MEAVEPGERANLGFHCGLDSESTDCTRCASRTTAISDHQTKAASCASVRDLEAKRILGEKTGDLVQVDTLEVRPLLNVLLKWFTARDMDSRWDVIKAYRSATAGNTRKFPKTLIERVRYQAKAIQVDGGGEFMADFEQACADKGIYLFVLPPRFPKLNGHVEKAQR